MKGQQKPTKPVVPKPPPTATDDTSPPSPSVSRSKQRLHEFQAKKRAQLLRTHGQDELDRLDREHEAMKKEKAAAAARAKLRALLWRGWTQYRPIFGGTALGYTSLREQYVYKRAAKLYNEAFKSDPGKSGRTLAAWLHHATPMEEDPIARQSASTRSSRQAKKPRLGGSAKPRPP